MASPVSNKTKAPLTKRTSAFCLNANSSTRTVPPRNPLKTEINKEAVSRFKPAQLDGNKKPDTVVKPTKITSKDGFDTEVEKKFDLMLKGDLNDLPHLPRSIVRIFLSSTFSDMRAERNMLARRVYPELRKRCAELGLDFQVVDLRWGMTSEMSNDHSSTKVCLQEVQTCQHVSLGPNFVGIMGHRYGMHRPLVVELSISDFENLLTEAKALKLDVVLIESWYKRDDNAVPPMYILQPIRSHFPHFGDNTPGKEEERKNDLDKWNDVHLRLQHAMQTAAQTAFKAKKISEVSWRQHFMSVTDFEIMKGIVEATHPEKHTLFFTRTLTGLNGEALKQNMADKYIDIVIKDGKPSVDKDTDGLIAALVDKVKVRLGTDQVIALTSSWHERGLDPEMFPEHQLYISQFCKHFLDHMTSLINRGIDQRKAKIRQIDWYTSYNEVLHHLRFCNSKCESFCGQNAVLQKAKEYIQDPSMRKPLIIHAQSGAGKTSVMAMIMKSLQKWLPGGYTGIIRFLGTSPNSLYVHSVLFNVCGQLADTANVLMERLNYRTWKGLKAYAPRLLRGISQKLKHPAVILLDSLDQLAPNDEAYSLDWLPITLPQNIKIIVSTLPEEHGLLARLKLLVPDPGCYCQVPLLPETTGQQIVHQYLQLRKRSITENQMSIMLKAFSSNPSPLYLKLLMDQAVKFPSFFTPQATTFPDSIRRAIDVLFDELEMKFGRLLVQSALGLLTVGLDGLSDTELEDALSCCDIALDEVYKFHDPPVPGIVRIPPVLWARIRNDLREYLVERLSQGKTTLFWYHRQFIEAAAERYASGRSAAELHAVLFEMFLAETGVKKTITLRHRRNLFVENADRQTAPQPMDAKNVRKLECLTYHLEHMKDVLVMEEVKSSVLCNFRFLSAKLTAFGVDKVLEDLRQFLLVHQDAEVNALKMFLESVQTSLAFPRNFAFTLVACLDPPASFTFLKALRQQAVEYLSSSDKPQFIPSMPCLALKPGDPSLMLGGFSRIAHQAGDFILAEKISVEEESDSFAIVNLATLEVTDVHVKGGVSQIRLTADGQNCAYLTKDSVVVQNTVAAKESSKSIADLFSGSKVVPKSTENMKLCISSDGTNVGLMSGMHALIVGTDLAKPTPLSFGRLENYELRTLLPGGSESNFIIASGDILGGESPSSFVSVWKSGSSTPSSVFTLGGSLIHSLVAVTADEESFVAAMQCNDGTISLAVIKLDPCQVMPAAPTKKISQMRVSSTEQVVGVLCDNCEIHFIYASNSSDLERFTHKAKVVDFDVIWEEGKVILAEDTGQITVCGRSGRRQLFTFMGDNSGIAFVKCINDSITILTHSGVIKAWDSAAASSLMIASSSTDSWASGNPDSLNYLSSVHNIMIDESGQELVTFISDGSAIVWNIQSQKKLRSLPLGIKADVVTPISSSLVAARDKGKKILRIFSIESGESVCENIIPNSVVAFAVTLDRKTLIIISEQPQLTLQTVDLDGMSGKVTKTVSVQLGFSYVSMEALLATSQRYVVLMVMITEADYAVIKASWKKATNLSVQHHPNRFVAVDLNGAGGQALHCFRPLTKIPHLGVSFEPYSGNTMLICTRRWIIFWDIPTGKCDHRLSRSTRKCMFYRPDWVKDASGANIAVARSPSRNLMAVGSEDGYMFMYEYESGMPVGLKPPATKHQAPVSKVCFTPDQNMVVSVCDNGILKAWLAKTATQVASMKLGSKVKCLVVTPDGQYLITIIDTERPRVAVFKLHSGKLNS